VSSFPLPTTLPVGTNEQLETYALSNLASVARGRHVAQCDYNQDPLVLSLIQSESSALQDAALDGYLSDLSDLSSSGSESEDAPGVPQYSLQDLRYAVLFRGLWPKLNPLLNPR